RAPVEVKEKVPMIMKRCPYPDERQGRMMNVSALAQITDHLSAALQNISAYRSCLPQVAVSWDFPYRVILDQLAQSGLFLLREGKVLPAELAVTYKVAAGYQVPLRELLNLELDHKAPPPSAENLLAYVKKRRALVGRREVCAAPMPMVIQVTEVLFGTGSEVTTKAAPERVAVTQALMLQTWLGIIWKRFDTAVEGKLLLTDLGPENLHPRTPHLRKLLADRLAEHEEIPSPDYLAFPILLQNQVGSVLQEALEGFYDETKVNSDTVALIASLFNYGEEAVTLTDAARRQVFAHRYTAYLRAYWVFVQQFEEIELGLRNLLGYPLEVPILLERSFFPEPRTLRWFELISGFQIRPDQEIPGSLVFKNHHRWFPIPVQQPRARLQV
ncbi:MAG: hypothetical protein K1Y36_27730, partial [Blastocatellia bacterium]|nr:hypothetical protein [Blastocatellia bacterium]